MTLFDDIDDDIGEVFFTDFSEPAEYNGIMIQVVVDNESSQTTDIPGFVIPVKTIIVKESDVAQPKAGDVVIMEGLSYRVGQHSRLTGRGVWTVPLSRKV